MTIDEIPNKNYFPARSGFKPAWLILHSTAGGTSAQAIANYFKSTESTSEPVSSHYVIGQDGTIVQCVKEEDGAWANGYLSPGHDVWWNESINPNLTTISIEHCKPSTDNSDQLTPVQKAASFQLIKEICQRHGIPMRSADTSGGITGHYSLDPVNRRDCPGPYPWSELWTFLQGEKGMDTIPAGWHDDGTTLIAPNGHKIVDGFRAHILASDWDATNEPLENECHVPQLSLGNTSLGGGQRQTFRDTMLYWTPSTNVQKLFVGEELLSCYRIVAGLQGLIARQQADLQKSYDTAPVVTAVKSPVNTDDLVAAVNKLIDVCDPIKTAAQKVLADIGKV